LIKPIEIGQVVTAPYSRGSIDEDAANHGVCAAGVGDLNDYIPLDIPHCIFAVMET
jgi:hypothetical protein